MAKYTHLETRPIVTLDYGHGPYSYYAASGERTIGGDGSLFFEHMALTPLSRMSVQDHPVTPEAPTTAESGLTTEQERGLKSILASAKQIERTQFISARAIERAAHDAEQAKAVADHDFNMAVLEALHAGLSTTAIEDHLNDAGFGQLEERVDSVHSLDIGLLYETEA